MITIQNYARVQSLEEAWELNQNKRNRILGGMLWLRLGSGNVNTAIDMSNLGLDTIEETELYVKIDTGCEFFFKSSQQVKATITIENAEGLVLVFASNEYTADENGVIEFTFDATSPIEFSIKNTSEEMKDITFTYSTYLG